MKKMVRSITPEDDEKVFDKKQNSKRFSYMKKTSNPWEKFGDTQYHDSNDGLSKHNNIPYQSKLKGNNIKKEFDLDNVWSIRNNVSVAGKQSPTTNQTFTTPKPGMYSRHKDFSYSCDKNSNNNQPKNVSDKISKQSSPKTSQIRFFSKSE